MIWMELHDGRQHPQAAQGRPREARRLRVHPMTAPLRPGGKVPPRRPPLPEIVVAGAHGGAGTSTLAALLAPAWDMGVIRPATPAGGLRPGGRPVVLVARNTAEAAGRAVIAVTAITGTGLRVAVLAVVSDGLPEPAEARYRFRVLDGRVPVIRVPFAAAFRAAGSPLQVSLPRRARQALAQIRALAAEQAPYPAPVTRPLGDTHRCQRSFSMPSRCTPPPGTSPCCAHCARRPAWAQASPIPRRKPRRGYPAR